MKNLTDKFIAFAATIECVILLVVVIFISLYFLGCGVQPRSTTMCFDELRLKYVQCYDNFKPGDIIPKEYTQGFRE